MSDIEAGAKPLMLPLMTGQATALNADACATLAQWALLKAMVDERVGSRVIPESDHASFFADRSIPLTTRVFLGRYSGPRNAFFDQYVFGPGDEADYAGTAYCTTMAVGALILQVAGFIFTGARQVETERSNFGSMLTEIWPSRRPRVLWPPIFTVSEPLLENLGAARAIGGMPPSGTS